MESLLPEWLNAARFNCLIPNPERFEPAWSEHLPSLDLVLCKTRHASRMFQALGANTAFTQALPASIDCSRASAEIIERFCMLRHEQAKGHGDALELWRRHPEWPKLTLVQHHQRAARRCTEHRHAGRATGRRRAVCVAKSTWQSRLPVGGRRVWPLSGRSGELPGGFVITTDGPPMNEHIVPTRGLLARYAATKTQCLATNYYVDPASLEAQFKRRSRCPPSEE